VLQIMNKFASPEKYRKAIRWLEDAGIMTWALFFIGFPGDGETGLANTISLVADTAPSFYSTQIWFYDDSTPIHKRAKEFELQGAGYTWKHKTMTWLQACDNVDRMLREVKSSLYVPQNGFSFETIFYLLGRGISFRYVNDFLETCRDVVVAGLGDNAVDSSKVFSKLHASYAAETGALSYSHT
jgi:anaerobic magnesium-protoporphyrin IX monomethyl ester cyclase